MKFSYEKFKNDRYNLCTQDELAENSGISVSIIKNMESGRKKISYGDENLEKLCEILNLNVDDYWRRDTKTLTCFNKKGGVGKTSLVCNLAVTLVSEFNKRVLLVDCDSQRNASQSFGMREVEGYEEKNIYKCFMDRHSIEDYIYKTDYIGLDIVVGHPDIANIDSLVAKKPYREERFKDILKDIKEKGEYDYIICDTAPLLSLFNNIILRATDGIIIPFEPEAFALTGVGEVMTYVKELQEEEIFSKGENTVHVLGVVINKYDKSTKISKAITEVVQELYPKKVFKTIISNSVVVKNAQSEKLPICVNYSNTPTYKSLIELAKEVCDGAEKL